MEGQNNNEKNTIQIQMYSLSEKCRKNLSEKKKRKEKDKKEQ